LAPQRKRGEFRPRTDARPGQDRSERSFIAAKRREKAGKPKGPKLKSKQKRKRTR
jgi:hypothetical protein